VSWWRWDLPRIELVLIVSSLIGSLSQNSNSPE
jgi:hypothetical protein